MKTNKIIGLILALGIMLASIQAQTRQATLNAQIEEFSKQIQSNPKQIEPYIQRGKTYFSLEKYDLAIEDFSKAIELDPKASTAYHYRGHSYQKMSSDDAAIKDFTKVVELGGESLTEEDYMYVAEIHFSKGNKKESAKFLNKAGFLLFQMGFKDNYDKAILYFGKAIELDPQNAQSYFGRARVNMRCDDLFDRQCGGPSSSNDLEKAILADPQMADAYLYRGSLHMQQAYYDNDKKEYELAIQYFTKAINLNSKEPDYYSARATAYRKLGKTSLAEADERKEKELKDIKKD